MAGWMGGYWLADMTANDLMHALSGQGGPGLSGQILLFHSILALAFPSAKDPAERLPLAIHPASYVLFRFERYAGMLYGL